MSPSVNNYILCFITWLHKCWGWAWASPGGLSVTPVPHEPHQDRALAGGEWAKAEKGRTAQGKSATQQSPRHTKLLLPVLAPGQAAQSCSWSCASQERSLWQSKVIFHCLQHWFWSLFMSKMEPEGGRSWWFYPNLLGHLSFLTTFMSLSLLLLFLHPHKHQITNILPQHSPTDW